MKSITELPAAEASLRPFDRAKIGWLADRTRQALSLGSRPGAILLKTLEEQCRFKVFHLNFETAGSSASIKSPGFGAAVLLSARSPKSRRNLGLARELFHLLTWQWSELEENRDPRIGSRPELADGFASALLLPESCLRDAVTARLEQAELAGSAWLEMAQEFEVPMETLAWRMHEIYAGPPADRQQAELVIRHALDPAFGPDLKRDNPPTLPARYLMLALTALRRGEISLSRFSEYIGKSRPPASCLERPPSLQNAAGE
jgi:Zn-dependent peptidase ImmA (M78 family)